MIGIDDALLGAAVGLGSSTATGMSNFFTSRYNRKEDAKASFKNYSKQAALDYAYANGPYYDLAQKYNEANYNLSRRYAENSAKWATTGLRKAGLNPILAASQGFNAQTGVQGVEGGKPSGGMPSIHGSGNVTHFDLAESMRDVAGVEVAENSAKKIGAETKYIEQQGDLIEAQTANTLISAINEAKTRGLSGSIGGLIGSLNSALSDLTGKTGDSTIDGILGDIRTHIESLEDKKIDGNTPVKDVDVAPLMQSLDSLYEFLTLPQKMGFELSGKILESLGVPSKSAHSAIDAWHKTKPSNLFK